MESFGILSAFARSIAYRKGKFIAASEPPWREADIMSFAHFEKIFPRFASILDFVR
jgi:hypothetical protein